MRRIVLTLLAVIVVAGLSAATGYAGYRLGYAQGAQEVPFTNLDENPHLRRFDEFGPRGLPERDFGFDREFRRGFGMRGFPMMRFGFFSPLIFLGQLLLLTLIAGLVYWLFTRSGWRLTRIVQPTEPPAQSIETEARNTKQEPEN